MTKTLKDIAERNSAEHPEWQIPGWNIWLEPMVGWTALSDTGRIQQHPAAYDGSLELFHKLLRFLYTPEVETE